MIAFHKDCKDDVENKGYIHTKKGTTDPSAMINVVSYYYQEKRIKQQGLTL